MPAISIVMLAAVQTIKIGDGVSSGARHNELFRFRAASTISG